MRAEWLRSRAGVLEERNFRRFYAGFVTSLLGSSMSTVAIAWAVLDSRVGATGLGLVFTATVVPRSCCCRWPGRSPTGSGGAG